MDMHRPTRHRWAQERRCRKDAKFIKVNGRNGADAFRMAADSSVLLLDENDPIV